MFKTTVIKDWTILRVIGQDGSRNGRSAHLLGTVESCDDPRKEGLRIVSAQLMDIDMRHGRVGTHHQDLYLLGDGDEEWVTLDHVRSLRRDLTPL